MQDDQFDVDAELDAASAIDQFQPFLARLRGQFRLAIALFGLAVIVGIAGLTGEFRRTVIERWFGQRLQRRHAAATGLADATHAGQRG